MTGIVVIVVLCVGYFGYDYYLRHGLQVAPQRPVPPVLDVAVNDICREVPGQLPEPERVLKPTLLLPLEGDRENIFADRLRSSLDQQGWYRPVDANLLNRTLDTIRELTGIGSDTSARSMQWSPTELANMMRSANAETVLRGSVDRLALPEGSPVEIKLRLELWGLSPTEPTTAVLIRSLLLERPESAAVTTNASKPTHWKAYGLIILIALVYPFATIPWMRHAIREDSNTAILKVLLGITAIPVLIFFVYLIWQGKDALTIVLQAGIAALLLFLYTAFILNTLQNKLK
jgi:hypothetical protein